jgi:hypothetical protein
MFPHSSACLAVVLSTILRQVITPCTANVKLVNFTFRYFRQATNRNVSPKLWKLLLSAFLDITLLIKLTVETGKRVTIFSSPHFYVIHNFIRNIVANMCCLAVLYRQQCMKFHPLTQITGKKSRNVIVQKRHINLKLTSSVRNAITSLQHDKKSGKAMFTV